MLAADDTWLYWPERCALSVYDKLVTSDTILECMRRCQQEDQFNCSSLDFHAGDTAGDQPMCYLRQQSRSDVRGSYIDTAYCYSVEMIEKGTCTSSLLHFITFLHLNRLMLTLC